MEKRKLIIYWVFTGLFTIGMLASGIQQLLRTNELKLIMSRLEYPAYFMTIIGVWKILGVIAVLMPGFKLLKEWAYAGFFFVMTGALISHLACQDYEVKAILGPLMQTLFIVLSWYYRPANRRII